MKHLSTIILVLVIIYSGYSQQHNIFKNSAANIDSLSQSSCNAHEKKPLHCLKDFFSKGHVSGHMRYYFMTTSNKGPLSTYYANGLGGLLAYHTAIWKGFQLGVEGVFIYNIGSSDLGAIDPIGGGRSRWELQLFDIKHPDNKTDLDRLEQLYIKYYFRKGSFVEYGKIGLETPLMNYQDTRMKAYSFAGFWSQIVELDKFRFNLGWIHGVSSRAMTHWYPIKEAIGFYGSGYTTHGDASEYNHHLKTAGVGIASAQFQPNSNFKFQVWDYFIENISNTLWLQADFNKKFGQTKFFTGVQFLRQDPINKGGNENYHYAYHSLDQRTNLISSQIGLSRWGFTFSTNYTYIAETGRYLFPRELGREKFYTTIPRFRIEGLGNTHMLVAKLNYIPPKLSSLSIDWTVAYLKSPNIDQYQWNKYQQIPFLNYAMDIRYHFDKFLQGLDFRLLYTYRQALEDYSNDYQAIFNKGDLHHLSFVLDINF